MSFADIDFEQLRRDGRERRAALRAQVGFRPVSLGDWLDLCGEAAVPYVPAGLVGEVMVEAVLDFDNPRGEAAGEFWRDVEKRMKLLGPGWMVRWDNCSLMDVKYELGSGNPDWQPSFAMLFADDMRGFDMVASFPSDRIRAWARPWVRFARDAGFPIEYRVFVENNRVIGVSSYYPQRPLEPTPAVAEDLRRIEDYASRLIAAQTDILVCPEISTTHDLTKNHWTADFGRLEDGAVLFLEGGPPNTPRWGAHPCCFEGREISGIALAKEEAPHD